MSKQVFKPTVKLSLWDFRELKKKREMAHEPYMTVDEGIKHCVQELNRWGLRTVFSCEGHEGENPREGKEWEVWRYVMWILCKVY